eukprot:scaffold2279_cov133-Skeletonema_marinoi.AAC.10
MNMNTSNAKPTHILVGLYFLMMLSFLAGFVLLSEWEGNIIRRSTSSSLQLKEGVVKMEDNHLIRDSPLRGSPDTPLPLAWLMSFPNSGTSYTITMVKKVTGRNTASNYGKESRGEDGMGVNVFAQNGTTAAGPPFWIDPTSRTLSHPTKGYILTKTHCGSRCNNCSVSKYVENHALFLQHCLEGRYNIKDHDGQLTEKLGSYDKALVKRAVHLIRDPFDNVVSRFHLHYKNLVKKNRADQIAAYPRTREGFRRFCIDEGRRYYSDEKQSKFYKDVFDSVKDVPCHADFYRYIQWHNLAFATTWDLNVPTIIVHYENYTDNFIETKDALLAFLGQDGIYDAPEFVTGKTYRDYYTADEIDAVSVLFSKLALEKTWHNTKHYFV